MTDTANETTKEFDLGELVGGSVASIIEKLPSLRDGELPMLRDLEVAGSNRTTLLSAIDQASADRDKTKAQSAEGGGSGTPVLFTKAQVDEQIAKALAEAAPVPGFTQEQLDAQLKARDEDHQVQLTKQRESFDELMTQRQTQQAEEIKLAVAKAREEKPATPKKTPVAKPILLGKSTDGPALVALAGSSSVVFADVDDVPIGTLPKMAFGPGDYEAAGDRVKLKREIEFPVTLPETQIASAFLLDEKGVASGKAELVMPFGVGGGRSSKLPAGTLSFAGSESYPTPAAAVAA